MGPPGVALDTSHPPVLSNLKIDARSLNSPLKTSPAFVDSPFSDTFSFLSQPPTPSSIGETAKSSYAQSTDKSGSRSVHPRLTRSSSSPNLLASANYSTGTIHITLRSLLLTKPRKYVAAKLTLGHISLESWHYNRQLANLKKQTKKSASMSSSDSMKRPKPLSNSSSSSISMIGTSDDSSDANSLASSLDDTSLSAKESGCELELNEKFEIPVTYHSYLFDSLKIYLSEGTTLKATKIGRAKLRIANLPNMANVCTRQSLRIEPPSSKLSGNIGAITLDIYFTWDSLSETLPKHCIGSTETLVNPTGSVKRSTSVKRSKSLSRQNSLDSLASFASNASTANNSDADFDDPERVKDAEQEKALMEIFYVDDNEDDEMFEADSFDPTMPIPTHKPSASHVFTTPAPPRTVSKSSASFINSSTSSLVSSDSRVLSEQKHKSALKTSQSSKGVKLMYGNGQSQVKYTKMHALREFMRLSESFFGEGWKVKGSSHLLSSLIALKKYQEDRHVGHPNPATSSLASDYTYLLHLRDLLQFSIASYGWLGINFFGYGNGFLYDGLRKSSNRKAILSYLKLDEDDLLICEMGGNNGAAKSKWDEEVSGWRKEGDESGLEWECWRSSGTICKPAFFVVKYDKLDSMVVCVRGSMSISDILTDIICHYIPFRGGVAHQGILHSALRIYGYLLPEIKSLIRIHKPRNLIFTGHSLGGAVCQFLTIFFNDHLDDLKFISSHNDEFKLSCYTFAAPPSLSSNVGDLYHDLITNVVWDNDFVPRLSYGNAMDLKEQVSKVAALKGSSWKSKLGIISQSAISKFGAPLDELRTEQHATGANTKLHSPGQSYHLVSSLSRSYQCTNKFSSSSKPKRHIEMWKVDDDAFLEILVQPGGLWNHMPNRYDKAFEKALLWAKEMEKGKKEEFKSL
ncbi:hypothetical protein BKA69DRAFT_1123977 [Paraphysoderma sedebokerense]|nr:hypothetical protein BKA69DRAFT_1123977 [Paraphysoderma sedebokerense]